MMIVLGEIIIKGQYTTGIEDKKHLDINLTIVLVYSLPIKSYTAIGDAPFTIIEIYIKQKQHIDNVNICLYVLE